MKHPRRRQQSGFALLFVFALAAIVAVLLYMELPRVAFEAQRDREELLIARGEQYKRGIQLFVRRFGTYPPTMEALENTNNIRFLRRRYKDPMTGSDEWRIIHAGPGGVFTDSLTQKPPAKKDDATASSSPSSDTATQDVPNPARNRRRASEGPPMPGDTPPPGEPSDQPPPPPDPANITPTPIPDRSNPAAPPVDQSGALMPGGPANPGGNQALEAIQKRLQTPTPMPGFSGGGQIIGAGIAGVASKLEAEGIKTYKDRTKYNEWEFLYDTRQDMAVPPAVGPQQGPRPGFQPVPQTGPTAGPR